MVVQQNLLKIHRCNYVVKNTYEVLKQQNIYWNMANIFGPRLCMLLTQPILAALRRILHCETLSSDRVLSGRLHR